MVAVSSLPKAALLVLLFTICVAIPIELVVESDPSPDDPAVQEHLRRQSEFIANEKLGRQGEFMLGEDLMPNMI